MEVILKEEYGLRKKLVGMGLQTGKMGPNSDKVSKKKTKREEEHVHQCDVCNYILHLSIVTNKTREFDLCLPHSIQHFHKTKSHIKGSLLLFDHTDVSQVSFLANKLSVYNNDDCFECYLW